MCSSFNLFSVVVNMLKKDKKESRLRRINDKYCTSYDSLHEPCHTKALYYLLPFTQELFDNTFMIFMVFVLRMVFCNKLMLLIIIGYYF